MKCNYCEGENQKRSVIMHDENNNPLMIWYENGKEQLLLDSGDIDLVPINYCPMCGRKLTKKEIFDEEC